MFLVLFLFSILDMFLFQKERASVSWYSLAACNKKKLVNKLLALGVIAEQQLSVFRYLNLLQPALSPQKLHCCTNWVDVKRIHKKRAHPVFTAVSCSPAEYVMTAQIQMTRHSDILPLHCFCWVCTLIYCYCSRFFNTVTICLYFTWGLLFIQFYFKANKVAQHITGQQFNFNVSIE